MIYLCVGLILVSVIGTICLMLFTPMKDIVYKILMTILTVLFMK